MYPCVLTVHVQYAVVRFPVVCYATYTWFWLLRHPLPVKTDRTPEPDRLCEPVLVFRMSRSIRNPSGRFAISSLGPHHGNTINATNALATNPC